MTENEPQELSPEAQREQDLARVQTQLGVTDLTQKVSSIFSGIFGNSGPGPYARTSFEAHELNAMIDLVENSDPADLETAGTALWKARDALRTAAKELQDYVDKVEWKGESGNEFRSFGRALADHARTLGSFADVAGTQITVAGTGLASVRKAMPPRDTRVNKQNVNMIEAPKRVEGNPEYDEAVKVEKNRQEAINQMTRLASFYAVSEETLAGQEAPRFDRILKADVPPPMGRVEETPRSAPRNADVLGKRATYSAAERRPDSKSTGEVPRTEITGTAPTAPDRNTSMEIDSVAAPPAVPTAPNAAPTVPAATGPGGSPPGPVPPMGGTTNPVPNAGPAGWAPGVARASGGPGIGAAGRSGAGGGGFPAAGHASAAGRAGVAGSGSGAAGGTGAAGRATGPMGAGSAAAGGRAGGVTGGTAGAPMAGRAGMAGQPMAGRAGGGTSSGPRTGRADGIVGGTPQRATGGSTGSRIPRGTVVGGEGTGSGRPSAARPSQAGVVGANPSGAPQRPAGRGTPSAHGVVGTPRTGGSGSRPGAGGFTAGGAGLAGGRPRQNQTGDGEDDDTRSARPDYLTEDEETWAARRSGAVPPVIE
ncbi:hypothetical protein ACIBCM_29050 [Streptomyces sp. NPDC051018]|uniref:hypothetical protein n=1 Tax=Streptomyces sp. NPDC051018 TaxID=3365639 RepID=UPI00378FA718